MPFNSKDLSGWGPLANELSLPYMHKLDSALRRRKARGEVFYPRKADILKAFRLTPLENVRVVIIGQDPYSDPGLATGLCFSVPKPLPNGTRRPYSLSRIYNAIATDLEEQPARTGDLKPWARDGVLLLNTVLTVAHRQPGSHQGLGWECFTNRAIQLVDEQPNPVVFLLWGDDARRKAGHIHSRRHLVLQSAHPRSPKFCAGPDGHFSRADRHLRAARGPIDWLRA